MLSLQSSECFRQAHYIPNHPGPSPSPSAPAIYHAANGIAFRDPFTNMNGSNATNGINGASHDGRRDSNHNNNNNNNNNNRQPASSAQQQQDDEEDPVLRALIIAREMPDAASDPDVAGVLEHAIADIWARVVAEPTSYVMSRNEFAVFNFFQARFAGNDMAIRARKRYWDNFSRSQSPQSPA